MSTCERFVQFNFRPEVCNQCFEPRSAHTAAALAAPAGSAAPPSTKALAPPKTATDCAKFSPFPFNPEKCNQCFCPKSAHQISATSSPKPSPTLTRKSFNKILVPQSVPVPKPAPPPKKNKVVVAPPQASTEKIAVTKTRFKEFDEVSYIIERLQEKDFNFGAWDTFLKSLSQIPLKPNQAEALLNALLPHTRGTNSFLALKALANCFAQVLEFRNLFSNLKTGDEKLLKLFIDTLNLRQILFHRLREFLEQCYTERRRARTLDPTKCGSEKINPYLIILYHLWKCCPYFSDYSNFMDLNMRSEDYELFWDFLLHRDDEMKKLEEEEEEYMQSSDSLASTETKLVKESLSRISQNKILDESFKKISSHAKINDCQNVLREWRIITSNLDAILGSRERDMRQRAEQQTSSRTNFSPSIQEQRQHRENVLKFLKSYSNAVDDAIQFFAENGLVEGVRLAPKASLVLQQTLRICEDSVASLLYGVMKTGKSTLLDSLLQKRMSAARLEPMTAIPTRYVHDPEAKEPFMIVPFHEDLSNVCELIKAHLKDNPKAMKEAMDSISMVQLKEYLKKIVSEEGVTFKNLYQGSEEVYQVSFFIHDLFRLAVQIEGLPKEVIEALPSNWGAGLDSHLTVYYRFPKSYGIPDYARLSVIDTPGVNEDGVQRLELHKMVSDVIELANHLIYTNSPTLLRSTDNAPLRKAFIATRENSSTPSDIFITNADNVSIDSKFISDVGTFMKSRKKNYPESQIHPVSGKRKLIGEIMLDFIETNKGKPADAQLPRANSTNDIERKLAEDFCLMACDGFSYDDRLRQYSSLPVPAVIEKSHQLINSSNLQQPIRKIMDTLINFNILLCCNRGVERALKEGNEITQYIHRLVIAQEDDIQNDQNLQKQHTRERSKLQTRSQELQKFLDGQIDKLKKEFDEILRTKEKAYQEQESESFSQQGTASFRSSEELEEHVERTLDRITQDYFATLEGDNVFDEPKRTLEGLIEELRERCQKEIFEPLGAIQAEMKEMPDDQAQFQLAQSEISLSPSIIKFKGLVVNRQANSVLPQKAKKKVGWFRFATGATEERKKLEAEAQNRFEITANHLSKIAKEHILLCTRAISDGIGSEIDRVAKRILSGWIMKAIQKLAQVDEALKIRGKLREGVKDLKRLGEVLSKSERELKEFIKSIPDYS